MEQRKLVMHNSKHGVLYYRASFVNSSRGRRVSLEGTKRHCRAGRGTAVGCFG
ncbi:unnamed protein product, partial [Nesidiocoris tenuis]